MSSGRCWTISLIEAGHFEANTAYAAVNTLRIDDLRPHIFRTHDSGKTWTEIVKGIPAGENPPDGAMIDYFLSKDAIGPVTIEIKDSKGESVRKYSSTDVPKEPDPKRLKVPSYWIRPPQLVST